MIIAILGAGAAFTAVTCVMLWFGGLRATPAEARLNRLGEPPRTPNMDAPFSERVMIPAVDSIAGMFMRVMPQTLVASTSHRLIVAGRPLTTQAFFTVVLLTGVLLPGSVVAFFFFQGREISFVAMLLVALFFVVGFILPFIWLRRLVNNRKLAVWKKLPDAFDLIMVSVEAGLGLDAALRQVADKLRGPLSDEIAQTLREVGMGRPRREALEEMAYRCDVPEVVTFVNAVIQAEQLGTSLGRVLRAQALSLRVRRRQRAQEMARKAPVKMVFPLVLFIMPTFFIVTLGPVFVHLVNYLNE